MIEIVSFEISHLDAMDTDPDVMQHRNIFAMYPRLGPAWTLMIENRPVISAGVLVVKDGLGEAWMFLNTKMIRRYPLTVFKIVKKGIDAIIEDCKLKRVQTFILDGHPTAHKWIRALGFHSEKGKAEWIGPDNKAYWIYGRTTRWLNM